MTTILYIILGILLLFLLIVMTKVNININYVHRNDDDELKVKVSLWKITVYRVSAPLIKIDENSASIVVAERHSVGGGEGSRDLGEEKKVKITFQEILDKLEETKEFLRHVVGFHKIVRRFLKHVNVGDLKWKSQVGIGDAALTGTLSGLVWSIKGLFIGILSNYMNLKERPEIEINPNFQTAISQTYFQCMISFRLGQAIVAALLIVRHWRRRPMILKAVGEKA